jgi:hypothetical protein
MNKKRLLAFYIDEILSGKSSVEDCVSRHPELEKDLYSLVKIAGSLKPDKVIPSPEFKERTRTLLFDEESRLKNETPGLWGWSRLISARVLTTVITLLFALVIAGGSTVYASQRSLPGDTLYPVKTGIENIQMALTPGTVAKANLRLKLVQRRIDETTKQVKANRKVNSQALLNIGQQLDNAIKEIGNTGDTETISKTLGQLSTATLDQQTNIEKTIIDTTQSDHPILEKALSMMRRANLIAQVAYNNREFLARKPSVTDEEIESGQFNVKGILVNIQGQSWNVGGVNLSNVIYSGMVPSINSNIQIEGVAKDNEIFISRIDIFENSQTTTIFEGMFRGTNPDGTADISGISIDLNDSANDRLKNGDDVKLQGNTNSSEMKVTEKTTLRNNFFFGISVRGTLTNINSANNEIKVKIAGNQVIFNISETRFENENAKLLSLSDANHMVGCYIKLNGVYKKNNRLFVRLVQVETRN